MSELLDVLRKRGSELLEHELPSLDDLRTVVGALVKTVSLVTDDDELAKLDGELRRSVAAPTNEGEGNAGDANGGAPANVQHAMPTAADIARELVASGALASLAPTPPDESAALRARIAELENERKDVAPDAASEPAPDPQPGIVTPVDPPAPPPPAASAPDAPAHTGEGFTPSPLPPPAAPPAISTDPPADQES